MRVKAVSGITLTLLLINMLTLAFNTQPVDANPVYPGQVTMTREDIDATISLADSVVQASVNGTYTFHVFGGTPPNPITMYYPVPPNSSNVSVKIDETPLAWDWNGTYYHTVLGDYPFIKWTILTYPAYFTIRTYYEHPVPLVDREYQFLYAMGTGRYLAEPKECEAYVRTYVSKDVAPTQSLMEVYLVTGEGIPEPATHEITSLDGMWNVSYHVTFWWGWSKDFLITIRANPWTVDDDGPADFQTIQEAINAANPGETILVYNGTYYEHVVVNKSLSLVGENRIATIIDGNGTEIVVRSNASDVEIRGFTIQNGGLYPNSSILVEDCIGNVIRDNIMKADGYGIVLNNSSNTVVDGNRVEADIGIHVGGGSGNNISNNFVWGGPSSCCIRGLVLAESSNNVVTGNKLGQHIALRMYKSNNNYIALNSMAGHFGDVAIIVNSNNNSIVDNTIVYYGVPSGWVLIDFKKSNSNVFYHNSFLGNNTPLVSIDDVSMNNTWDNGYEGNYWSNYNGTDLNGDGIGDTYLPWETVDFYPLMNPYTWGDVNHDGETDILDIKLVKLAYSEVIEYPYADLDGNDVINILDLKIVKLIYSGYL